jgi:hypothetical protein
MKISVSIPLYDGKLAMQSVACLLAETQIAVMMGDHLTVNFLPSCTNLALGRNQLVKEFLASSADRLVFLDADVTFEPGALLKIAHSPMDFVGGAYRLKQDEEAYPVSFINEEPSAIGLIEAGMVPTGFLSLSRKVFEQFKAAYPRSYEIGGNKVDCYFQIPYRDGALYTEDAYFCREWKEAGGRMFLEPEIELTHWSFNTPYVGHLGRWLRRRAGLVPAA